MAAVARQDNSSPRPKSPSAEGLLINLESLAILQQLADIARRQALVEVLKPDRPAVNVFVAVFQIRKR